MSVKQLTASQLPRLIAKMISQLISACDTPVIPELGILSYHQHEFVVKVQSLYILYFEFLYSNKLLAYL